MFIDAAKQFERSATMTFSAIRHALSLACMAMVTGCMNRAPPSQNMVTQFSDMSDTKFTLQANAPPGIVRELTVCKAVWFAEKMKKASLSLTNPKYSEPTKIVGAVAGSPPGWTRLTATAYLAGPNPDGNPTFLVADKAPTCRANFDWYH